MLRIFGPPLALPLAWLARRSDGHLGFALVYHRVDDPHGDPRRELVPAMGTSLFTAQVRHLCSRYRVVAASELLGATRQRRRGEPFPVAITFDDDLATHADVVAPILASAGATAAFFLSGASLHAPYRFWWERLQAAVDRRLELRSLSVGTARRASGIHELGRQLEALPPAARKTIEVELERIVGPDPPEAGLRAENVERLATAGAEIGFHTRRHDLLPSLDDDDLARAMEEGRSELADTVGQPLTAISYPHGRADARVASAARAAGFDVGFTGSPELVTDQSDPLLLGRLSPSYRSLGEFAFEIAWTILRATVQR
ncbi:MAG TPA: polysaccharide deacetylase family protein [Gaiellaceae bacterium]|jgi:peptidoglycan/xylan/chitin deacetylase (PgdA/CDA1 family)